eukprot:1878819-Pleurochrysis_carterae.AAC.1
MLFIECGNIVYIWPLGGASTSTSLAAWVNQMARLEVGRRSYCDGAFIFELDAPSAGSGIGVDPNFAFEVPKRLVILFLNFCAQVLILFAAGLPKATNAKQQAVSVHRARATGVACTQLRSSQQNKSKQYTRHVCDIKDVCAPAVHRASPRSRLWTPRPGVQRRAAKEIVLWSATSVVCPIPQTKD